jgi:predicted O-methyltransferase YrrM
MRQYTREGVGSTSDEIRRLREENVRLENRLAAFERSRWWRLHPRLTLERALRRRGSGITIATASSSAGHIAQADPVVERFRVEVVARGTFTKDWFTGSIPGWHPFVAELEHRKTRLLEIGSFEGLATCYLLWRLADAQLTCIDTFVGSPEHEHLEIDDSHLEATFDRNVTLIDASRVRKIVGDSKRALLELIAEGASFEFVYIDGSHAGLDVIVDAALAWQLLAKRGVLVFDDYTWAVLGADPLVRPGPAIDAFLQLVEGKHDIVLSGHQLGLRKTSG